MNRARWPRDEDKIVMVSFACQVPIFQKDNELPEERGNLLVGQLWKCRIQTLLAGGSTEVTGDSPGLVCKNPEGYWSGRWKILLTIKK